MSLKKRIARRLHGIQWVRHALSEPADLRAVLADPSLGLAIALGLGLLSMVFGWPAVTLLGSMAATFDEPLLLTQAAPASYAFSWVLFGVSVLVGGKESLERSRRLNRWMVRRTFHKLFGHDAVPPADHP